MANRLAGIASLTVGGTSYPVVGKATYSPGTVTRETLTGQDQVHGYKEMPRAPFISATVRDAYGQSVASFNAMTDETVVLQLANGKTIIGQSKWTVETQDVDTEEASFDLRFEGLSVTES
jgi:hypothetical protein